MNSIEEYQLENVCASLPRTVRGLPLVLSCSADGKRLVYCNGNSVYIRNTEDWSDCDVYTEHAASTTVAKFSPSGYYIASGDHSGKVRIWDATQPTHLLKAEYPIISGAVRDISWSDDSKRIAVVGEGRERFGHVFLFDTGTSNGNLSGQSRPVSSVDFKPTRPYRLICGSEDKTVAIFEGPPFKFKTLFHAHDRFVHCVRYSSDGARFASAGADGRVVIYEGAEGANQGEFVDPICDGFAHSGSVFSLSWSPDNQSIATASGDKSVKVWNAATRDLMRTFKMGDTIEDQQLSVIWMAKGVMSVSLSGFINHLDPASGNSVRVIKGHNKPITSVGFSPDRSKIFTADFQGNITRWCLSSGKSDRISPSRHTSQVSGMVVSERGELFSVGWDDHLLMTDDVFNDISDLQESDRKVYNLYSQPRGISASSDGRTTVVACQKSVAVVDRNEHCLLNDITYESTCISITPDGKRIAVGGQDAKVHLYEWAGTGFSLHITEVKELRHSGTVTSVSWSPDGNFLVVTDSARKVVPYSVANDFAVASERDWTFHSARVCCCAWSEDSRYIASGGIDTNIIIWDLKRSSEHPIIIKGAHAMSPINGLVWLGPGKILSVGQDSNIKIWSVKVS